ncbi:MAG: aminoacyl-tRNA hydrolase [Bacteroidota bacterium]
MKFLVVGLGNPGTEYDNTRHNIGFTVVDVLAKKHGGIFVLDRGGHRTTIKFKGKTLVLIKPTTYMNLSGKAVNYWLQKEGVSKENLLVVTDDLALPFGKIRLKGSGSDGGHNGLKDIQFTLQSNEYARLRLGIGSDFAKGRQSDFVLGKWSEEEQLTLNERVTLAVEACEAFCAIGLQLAMSQFNGK